VIPLMRTPYFCPGCPHNQSTKVPEGSCALGGVGCHLMAVWMDRATPLTISQMGGEGAAWIGMARHTGTRTSSPTWATAPTSIPACWRSAPAVAAGVNITYKILYNDAVAMTGGQPVDGTLTCRRSRASCRRGRGRIVVITDDPEKYGAPTSPPASRSAIATSWTRPSASCANAPASRP
jgi:indolepyruvate ferredoxin oxidoreductase